MMLQRIQLINFRNYENQLLEFSAGLNCIIGKNGSGKTNILDAIYFLALTKSSIHSQDVLSIKFGEEYLQLEGFFNDIENELITCSFQKGGKKTFFTNKKPYERISDHIGKYPLVLIAPDDTDLIRDSSETRRKLIDGIISQFDLNYLKLYQKYNRTLDQRNSLIKQFSEHNYFDEDLLKIYSLQLLETGEQIYLFRKKFVSEFLPLFSKYYSFLSDSNEKVNILYQSELENKNFSNIFLQNIGVDLSAQRTTKGVHKDDFEFIMEDKPIKKYGSQGQKKSFIMAIRLAQFELIQKEKNRKPILLLDDIFDKLDEKRIKKLLELIKNGVFGQIFLTDARPNRTKDLIRDLKLEAKFIETDQSNKNS